jgi:hypothetical protein
MKAQGNFPLGKSEKMNVALQRPTVNVKEAENVAEEASAAAEKSQPGVKFSKHGVFGPSPSHSVSDLFGRD